jgi:hypothetical protein
MMGRRAMLLSAAAVSVAHAAPAQPGIPEDNRIAFLVVREGSAIGSHVLTFARSGNALDIQIEVTLAVGFGPLTFFRYTMRGREQWRDGAVYHVEATTDDDGTPQHMRADRDARGLWVEGSQTTPYLAPENALPASHWNMAELQTPWINPQGGQLLHPIVRCVGTQPVALANGRSESATGYSLSGDANLDLWYDAARQWSALRFVAKDGSLIRYEMT